LAYGAGAGWLFSVCFRFGLEVPMA
jgi:hypothetical protein